MRHITRALFPLDKLINFRVISFSMLDQITITYDKLGGDYYSNSHSTTKCMYLLQDTFMTASVVSTRKFNPKLLSEMEVLVAGAGSTGNSRQVTSGGLDDSRESNDQTLDPHRITYLDISRQALTALYNDHAETLLKCGGYVPGKFVQGDASRLDGIFKKGSFDVVIAGLCDHILPWTAFFDGVKYVLRKNGALITTYPAKEIFTTIREKIYGIPSDKTRFVVDDQELMLDSLSVTDTGLEEMYRSAGFRNIQTIDIFHQNDLNQEQPFLKAQGYQPSKTLQEAAELISKSLEQIPILVGGIRSK